MGVQSQQLKQEDIVWGAVIIGGIIAAIAWRTMFNEKEVDDEVLQVIPSSKLRKKIQNEEDDEQDSLIIAVAATPKLVGGILRLPKHKRLYYYSFNWTDHFSFPHNKQESQKFELANALVSLVVFQSDIQFFRHRYKKLLLKTDNNIFLKYERERRFQEQELGKTERRTLEKLFDKVQDRLTFYQGQFKEVHRDEDIDMFQACELCKTGSLQYIPKGYNTYEITDWSVQARLATESNMKQRINNKYTHAVDDYY